jgi:diguanylate cyclase (GGDEF)-like protein
VTGTDRQRLLVIEDDPEIQYILSVVLADDGREIIAAESAEKARAELSDGDIDLVILDLILPDADGRSLLSELRASRATAAVPVVVMTARAAPEIRQDCYALGADAFVEKPFDAEEFSADIAVRLERAAQAEREALGDPLTGLLNRAGLEAICAEASDSFGLGLIQVDGFGTRSERWGWDKTERIVLEVARALRDSIPEDVELGRVGGGDFVLVARSADLATVSRLADEALEIIRGLQPEDLDSDEETLTATIAVLSGSPETPLEESLEIARQRIFQARAAEGDHVVAEDVSAYARQGHVLVAEDDEISATILLHRLEKEGLDVVRYDNGQEAYEDALRETPVLVILDVKMPGLDGFEVLERLRKDQRFSGTPVIMLTSMGQEADVVRAFRMGADDYILKPFSPTELSARVRRLLTRGRSAASL